MAVNPKRISDCTQCLAVALTHSGVCMEHGLGVNAEKGYFTINKDQKDYWQMSEDGIEKYEIVSDGQSQPIATFTTYPNGEVKMSPNPNSDKHSAFDEDRKVDPNTDSHSAFVVAPEDEVRDWLTVVKSDTASDFYDAKNCEYHVTEGGALRISKSDPRKTVMYYSPIGWQTCYIVAASLNQINDDVQQPNFPLGLNSDE